MLIERWETLSRSGNMSPMTDTPAPRKGTPISRAIAALRDDAGMVNRELGALIDAGESQISNWANGRTTPEPHRVLQIAELFQLDDAETLDLLRALAATTAAKAPAGGRRRLNSRQAGDTAEEAGGDPDLTEIGDAAGDAAKSHHDSEATRDTPHPNHAKGDQP